MEVQERKGFAIAASLLAALLIAALVAGVFFAATEETRTTSALTRRQTALTESESALARALATLADGTGGTMTPGSTLTLPADGPGKPVVYLTRLDSTLFYVVADGSEGGAGNGASRRIGLVVRRVEDAEHSITIDRIPHHAWSELF